MKQIQCPKCSGEEVIKSGIVKNRQRYRCKKCGYSFTVFKDGKSIDSYYVIKALQLYIEGISFREIERLIGVSHVSVMNWVKKYTIKAPEKLDYYPSYKVLKHSELIELLSDKDSMKNLGMIITELGDKFMIIKWERLKSKH